MNHPIAKDDILPINGPARFSFNLVNLAFVTLPDWPPDQVNRHGWETGLHDFRRHWPALKAATIWAPWPILSYCVGSVEAPVPNEALSPTQRMAREFLAEQYGREPGKLELRFFLFPTSSPKYQSQAVAQLCCESKVGAPVGDVRMWIDALREDELSDENVQEIRSATSKNG
jgi:hypothetical protein